MVALREQMDWIYRSTAPRTFVVASSTSVLRLRTLIKTEPEVNRQ